MYNWAVKVVTNHRIRKNLTKNYKFEDRRKNTSSGPSGFEKSL